MAATLEAAAPGQRRRPVRRPAHTKPAPAEKPAALKCGDILGFQVLLDRQGFSSGEIDGKRGVNFTHALAAFQAERGIPASGAPDCATWQALGGDTAGPTLVAYTISDADMKGPFAENIPRSLPEQARLPALAYRSPFEKLAERFHVSPTALRRMNPGVRFKANAQIRVPAVPPFEAGTKPSADPAAAGASVQVSREESALRVTRADGSLLFFAPVTTGSEHDPLPQGEFKVTGVKWNPVFHYNPDLFWDAKKLDSRATIKAGPNNPVGVVWIDLSLEHYGLHGTPEPGKVGHTESHGCVRLTNWDAARVTALVRPGTPVAFR